MRAREGGQADALKSSRKRTVSVCSFVVGMAESVKGNEYPCWLVCHALQ